MTANNGTSTGHSKATQFQIAVSDEQLAGIRNRLDNARIGYQPASASGWSHGVPPEFLARLRDHWLNRYDWRRVEAHLNRHPHFRVTIDDVPIHFTHIRAGKGHGFPIILTHGWPGSFFEFDRAADLLAEQGFDLVIPSLPGFGLSGAPPDVIGPRKVAGLWRKLMVDVLGYTRFGAQGGDWGSAVTSWLGRDHGDVVAAIHLNLFMGPVIPSASDDEAVLAWRGQLQQAQAQKSAYMLHQAADPQTIGQALADTPLGFAGYIIQKFNAWGDTGGTPEPRFSLDDLITNAMLYLVGDTVQSAIWMYRSIYLEAPTNDPVTVPTGCALFPAEFLPLPPRPVAEKVYNVTRWTEMTAGGHFAAMEEPQAFADDVAAFFATVAG